MSWSSLPAEMHQRIFSYLRDSKMRPYRPPCYHGIRPQGAGRPSRLVQSGYAVVNRDWQWYFEARNFQNLILGHEDTVDFYRIVREAGRGHLVRRIWLRVELPRYGCDRCSKPEDEEEVVANKARFTLAVWHLFDALSGLETLDGDRGIDLELSAHSPSDAEHYCQEWRQTMEDTRWCGRKKRRPYPPDDTKHGWQDGRRRPLTRDACFRVLGHPHGLSIDPSCFPSGPKRLPRVGAVKSLMIRLQFCRFFSIRLGLDRIIQVLPNLATIHYECRKGPSFPGDGTCQLIREKENRLLFKDIVPRCKQLRKLVVYEAPNHSYCTRPTSFQPDVIAGRGLALQSRFLEELYITWMIDSRDFFRNFRPDAPYVLKYERMAWPNLKHLCITTLEISTGDWADLLRAAGTAARNMGNLRTMELWARDGVNLFLYTVEDRRHTIAASGCCLQALKQGAVPLWQRVVEARGSPLNLRIEEMEAKNIFKHPRSLRRYSCSRTTQWQLYLARKRIIPSA